MKILSLLFVSISYITIGWGAFAEYDGDDPREFFPLRPKNAQLHTMTGILKECDNYNWGEDILLELPNGKEKVISLGAKTKILGKPISCLYTKSEEWPKQLILGKTKVTVTYWYQKKYYPVTEFGEKGEFIIKRDYKHYQIRKVTDQIDLVK